MNRIVTMLLAAVPALSFADAVTLNGVPADVKVTADKTTAKEGILNAPITIDVEGSKYELQAGGKVNWIVSISKISVAVLAKDTPVKAGGQSMTLKGGTEVEFNPAKVGERLKRAQLASDTKFPVPGGGEVVARAAPAEISFDNRDGRLSTLTLAAEARLGSGASEVVASPGVRVTLMPNGAIVQKETVETPGAKSITHSFFGQKGEIHRAEFANGKLKTVKLMRYVVFGKQTVAIADVTFKDDGTVESMVAGHTRASVHFG